MKSGAIAEKLSGRISLGKKSAKNIVELICDCLKRFSASEAGVTIKSVGTLKRVHRRMLIKENPDGSCKVIPPLMSMDFVPYTENQASGALRTSQMIIAEMMLSDNITYETAKDAYGIFCKVVSKSLGKGKRVKIAGLGVFSSALRDDESEVAGIHFSPSEKLLSQINEPFAMLEEKITFPIPPLAFSVDTSADSESGYDQDDTSESPIKKKLALISGDLIRLNEEINKKRPEDSGRSLWG